MNRTDPISGDSNAPQNAVARVKIGEKLAEARDLHRYKREGGFEDWCRERLGVDPTTARNYIMVAETVAKSGQLSRLSRSAIQQFNRAPAEIQTQIVQQIEADGKVFTRNAFP